MPAEPRLSVVLPAWRAAWCLGDCLESLEHQSIGREGFELIVVDRHSPDGTAELARAHGATLLQAERPGPSAARNTGWRAAHAPLILFLDADTVAEPDWARRMAQAFEADPGLAGAGGLVRPWRIETPAEIHAHHCHILDQEQLFRGDPPLQPPFFATANAAWRRAALEQLDGFDETLHIGEDADLAWRAQWQGLKLGLVPEARVRHKNRAEWPAYLRQLRNYGRGSAELFARHRDRLGPRRCLTRRHWRHLATTPLRAARALREPRGSWERRAPWYDLTADLAWLAGRLEGSLRHGVLAL